MNKNTTLQALEKYNLIKGIPKEELSVYILSNFTIAPLKKFLPNLI